MNKVLFACGENRKRRQMAEALFNHIAKFTGWRAESAGTMPADATDPLAFQVLQEAGVPAKNQKPKKITQETLDGTDMIVSFGCLVPSMFQKDKFREWIVDDPKTLDGVRRGRDDLREKNND